MLGSRNHKERLNRQAKRQTHFGVRKFKVGVASVAIATSLYFMGGQAANVHAEEAVEPTVALEGVETGEEKAPAETPDVPVEPTGEAVDPTDQPEKEETPEGEQTEEEHSAPTGSESSDKGETALPKNADQPEGEAGEEAKSEDGDSEETDKSDEPKAEDKETNPEKFTRSVPGSQIVKLNQKNINEIEFPDYAGVLTHHYFREISKEEIFDYVKNNPEIKKLLDENQINISSTNLSYTGFDAPVEGEGRQEKDGDVTIKINWWIL